MNGQDHYRDAERLLRWAMLDGFYVDGPEGGRTIQAAQVHATLALAAATGCVGNEGERRAWLDCTDDDAHAAVSS